MSTSVHAQEEYPQLQGSLNDTEGEGREVLG